MFMKKFSTIALCFLAFCGSATGGIITVTFSGTLTPFPSASGVIGTLEAMFVLDPSLLSAPNDTETITNFSLDADIFSPETDLESVLITPDSTINCFTGWTCFPSASASVDSSGQVIMVTITSVGCFAYGSSAYGTYCAYSSDYEAHLSYPVPFNGNELIPGLGPNVYGAWYQQNDCCSGSLPLLANGSSVVDSPEPSSIILMGIGMASLAVFWLRRARCQPARRPETAAITTARARRFFGTAPPAALRMSQEYYAEVMRPTAAAPAVAPRGWMEPTARRA